MRIRLLFYKYTTPDDPDMAVGSLQLSLVYLPVPVSFIQAINLHRYFLIAFMEYSNCEQGQEGLQQLKKYSTSSFEYYQQQHSKSNPENRGKSTHNSTTCNLSLENHIRYLLENQCLVSFIKTSKIIIIIIDVIISVLLPGIV